MPQPDANSRHLLSTARKLAVAAVTAATAVTLVLPARPGGGRPGTGTPAARACATVSGPPSAG